MTRRDLLKTLAAFAACIKAYEKTPEGAGLVVVRIDERHSDLCLMRGSVELVRERIPIGRWHFVNDVAWCLSVTREDAAELVRKNGIPPQGALGCRENGEVTPEFYAEVIEARAVEFAGFIRETLRRTGAGDVPVVFAGDGAHIARLSETVKWIV